MKKKKAERENNTRKKTILLGEILRFDPFSRLNESHKRIRVF